MDKSDKKYNLPIPLVDKKEQELLKTQTEKYEKLIQPSGVKQLAEKVSEIIPDQAKELAIAAKETLTEKDLYKEALNVIGKGFKAVQEQSAKYTVSVSSAVKKAKNLTEENIIETPAEFCLIRAYDLANSVDKDKLKNLGAAFGEGFATGAPGFAGIPFNLVLSNFLYFRAVQTIALSYGYDVKNNPSELEIAGQVFACAFGSNDIEDEGDVSTEMQAMIGKIMLISEMSAIKQTATKTWTDMAARGGIGLLLTQIRALAHKSAQIALEKVGKQGLESTVFRNVFEQIGKRLTLGVIQKSVPVVSGFIGAAFDAGMMKKVLDYADIFYCKRFILEKEANINALLGENTLIEVYEIDQSKNSD